MGKYQEWAHTRAAEIERVRAEGVRMVEDSGQEPAPTAGVFGDGFPPWKAGKTYRLNEPFFYAGMVGFSRQNGLIASDVYPPFSTGTESLYGVRPVPDIYGVYPYVYNMAASVGMRVRDTDGTVYECYQAIDPLLYPPSAVPAHFTREE